MTRTAQAPLPGLTLAIQAGGRSRRMGRDKALLPFGEGPLIAHILARLGALAEQALVTTNHPQALAFLGVPCYPDRLPGRGALGGLYTALYHAGTPLVAIVACDMPFASPALFRRAWAQLQRSPSAPAVVPRTAQGWEPFHGVYRREACLPKIEAALRAGVTRVQDWLAQLPALALEVAPAEEKAFWNLNTPEDYRRALAAYRSTSVTPHNN